MKTPPVSTDEGTLVDVDRQIHMTRQSYTHIHHSLSSKINVGELKTDELKQMYVQLAEKLKDFPEHLFKKDLPPSSMTALTQEDAVEQKLIHCFAANLATKHLDQETFDQCFDHLSSAQSMQGPSL
jgi:hypothetical protein